MLLINSLKKFSKIVNILPINYRLLLSIVSIVNAILLVNKLKIKIELLLPESEAIVFFIVPFISLSLQFLKVDTLVGMVINLT
jgi:hypothetical protein